MAAYSRRVFGMFSGQTRSVRMRFDAHLAGAVLDRLGADVMLVPDGADHFTVTAEVVPSPLFYAWLFGFGPRAELLGPESVVAEMRQQLAAVAGLYQSSAAQNS